MKVSKDEFVKEVMKRQFERKQHKYKTKLDVEAVIEHGVRSVSNWRLKGWGS